MPPEQTITATTGGKVVSLEHLGRTIYLMAQCNRSDERHMPFKAHRLTKEAEKGRFLARPPLSLSGALRAYYEWQYSYPADHNDLLQSSAAFNLMQVVRELYDEGHLKTEMLCLNEKVKGQDPGDAYGQSLRDLLQCLTYERECLSDETLGKVVMVAFQASLSDLRETDFWIHMQGLSTVVYERGPRNFSTRKAQYLIRACRISMLYADMFCWRESCFAKASWSYGIGHQAAPTAIDLLVDIMVAVSVLLKKLNTPHTDEDDLAPQALMCDIFAQLNSWYTLVGNQTDRSVRDRPVNGSNSPFQSFLVFANPISAEVYLMYYTMLLILTDVSDFHPTLRRVKFDLSMRSPQLDAFQLACYIGRMVPYFLAGGVLGYFIIDFPARFALRSFRRLGAVRHESWLNHSLSQVQMAHLEATDFFSENPCRHYRRC